MPESERIAGRFRLLGRDGGELESSDATFEPQPEALLVHPRQQAPLRVDFSDVDALAEGDRFVSLTLAGGERVELSMLGRRHRETISLVAEALEAYQLRHLLLQEPVGGEAFSGEVRRGGATEGTPAAVRVFGTSLAVLPRAGVPFGVPFGEVAQVSFDPDRWAVDLSAGEGAFEGPIAITGLGKATEPCRRLLEERLTALRRRGADALAALAPQLGSLALRRLAQAMPDGVPARRAALDAIDPSLFDALLATAAGTPALRKSCAALAAMAPPGEAAIGLKETNARQDAEEEPGGADPDDAEAEEVAGQGPSAGPAAGGPMAGRVVFFAFPLIAEDRSLPGNAVAFEAATRAGRATYLFRVAPPEVYRAAGFDALKSLARARLSSVCRAMVALGFRREPIALPEEKLRSPAFSRYRLAMRLSAPLKEAREAFVGRALHTAAWNAQLAAALAQARG